MLASAILVLVTLTGVMFTSPFLQIEENRGVQRGVTYTAIFVVTIMLIYWLLIFTKELCLGKSKRQKPDKHAIASHRSVIKTMKRPTSFRRNELSDDISYLELAGHTFPDPSSLNDLMNKMNDLQTQYEELMIVDNDNITVQNQISSSLRRMSTYLSRPSSETTNLNVKTNDSNCETKQYTTMKQETVSSPSEGSSAAELVVRSSNSRYTQSRDFRRSLKSFTADYF